MTVNINVSLPEFLVNKIDQQRGDIPRSKFILRLLERAYRFENTQIQSEAVQI